MDTPASISPRTAHQHGDNLERRALKRKASNYDDEDAATIHKRRVVDASSVVKTENINTGPVTEKKIILKVQRPMTKVELARNRFYLAHQDIFRPLLPSNSLFLTNLAAKMCNTGPIEIVPYQGLTAQPTLVKNGTMKDYQLDGLSKLVYWHLNGVNGILGDEVGLGKSIQTLSLFAWVKEHDAESTLPHLIICPKSVLNHWMEETKRWLPSFKIVQFHGSAKERDTIKHDGDRQNFNILVTTYECAKSDNFWLKSHKWNYIVLDEGHRIKNSQTEVASKLQHCASQHRLVLSGTAIQNKLLELWGLLHWLHGSMFTDTTAAKFAAAFDLSAGSYSLEIINACHELLQLVMLRRTKAEVELSVPPLEELTVFLPLSELQRRCYLVLLRGMDMQVDVSDGTNMEGAVNAALDRFKRIPGQFKKLQNLLLQLRRMCDHPFILPEVEPSEDEDMHKELVPASSKFVFLEKLFASVVKQKKQRVLIFSQWTDTLELLKDFCDLQGVRAAVLHGQIERARRSLDIKLFQELDDYYDVFLISTKAGGQGITLTRAEHVVLFDSSWNPQDDLQAIGRAHRIGQTKTVKVYRLICKESVEDQMLERLQKKLYLSVKLNSSAQSNANALKKPVERDLLSILFFGSCAVRQSLDGHTPEDFAKFRESSLSEILAESKGIAELRRDQLHRQLGEQLDDKVLELVEAEERRLLQGVTQVQTRLFEGKMHHRAKDDSADSLEQIAHDIRRSSKDIGSNPTSSTLKERDSRWKNSEEAHEEFCIICRGLYAGPAEMCWQCPRVFHEACWRTVEPGRKRSLLQACPQHKCRECEKSSAEVGGLLYRCRTCPYASCEKCLPHWSELKIVGDELPEFKVLGKDAVQSAFFIQCPECIEYLAAHPDTDAEWKEEWRLAELKLAMDRT